MALTLIDLIVEDGSGLPTANSYVSFAEANAYFERHMHAQQWDGLPDIDRRVAALIQAARLIDSVLRPTTAKIVEASGMLYPRWDSETGESTGVPTWLKHAQCEETLFIVEKNPFDLAPPGVSGLSVGGASISYSPPFPSVVSPFVRAMMSPYCLVSGGLGTAQLLRV